MLGQAGDVLWGVAAAVAGVAGHGLFAAKICRIDGFHHQDHFARGLLGRSVDGIFSHVTGGLCSMAVNAIHAQRGGNKSHRSHELVHGESAENLNVLKDIIGHLRLFLWRSLAVCRDSTNQEHNGHHDGTKNDSPRPDFHVAFLACRARRANPSRISG